LASTHPRSGRTLRTIDGGAPSVTNAIAKEETIILTMLDKPSEYLFVTKQRKIVAHQKGNLNKKRLKIKPNPRHATLTLRTRGSALENTGVRLIIRQRLILEQRRRHQRRISRRAGTTPTRVSREGTRRKKG
jgi:hypothetical protein